MGQSRGTRLVRRIAVWTVRGVAIWMLMILIDVWAIYLTRRTVFCRGNWRTDGDFGIDTSDTGLGYEILYFREREHYGPVISFPWARCYLDGTSNHWEFSHD